MNTAGIVASDVRASHPEQAHGGFGLAINNANVTTGRRKDIGIQVALLRVGQHAVQAAKTVQIGEGIAGWLAVSVVFFERARKHIQQVTRARCGWVQHVWATGQ